MIYKNEETDAVNLFESEIVKILFDKGEGNHITFIIDWSECDEEIRLVCNYCTGYRSEINTLECYSNFLCAGFLITGFSYKKTSGGYIVQINFDLLVRGFIKFKCDDFFIETESEPFQPGGNDNLIEN